MDPIRPISRMTYQAAYAASMILPARNSRAKRDRARRFAAKAEANAQKHAPAGIAIAVNLFVLGFLGSAKIREEHVKDDQAIEAVMDNEGFFVRTAPKAEPPSGGGGGGSAAALAAVAQNIAINVPTESPKVDIGALTTSAPAAFTMNPTTPSAPTQGIGEALAKGTGQGGNGTGSGTGNGTGTGPGTGSGTGGGNETGTGTGNGSAEGTYLAGGNALPKGKRVLLIVDNSGSIEFRKKIASKVKNEIKLHDKANKTVEVDSSLFSHVIPSIKAGIKSKYDVIIWITDLQDHVESEYLLFQKYYPEYERIEKLLKTSGTKFFITSFEGEPTTWLTQIVKSSGGSFSIQRE